MSDHDSSKCPGCLEFIDLIMSLNPRLEAIVTAAVLAAWREHGPKTSSARVIEILAEQVNAIVEQTAPIVQKLAKERVQ